MTQLAGGGAAVRATEETWTAPKPNVFSPLTKLLRFFASLRRGSTPRRGAAGCRTCGSAATCDTDERPSARGSSRSSAASRRVAGPRRPDAGRRSAPSGTLTAMARRSYGTGHLYIKSGAYYGRWRAPAGPHAEPQGGAGAAGRHAKVSRARRARRSCAGFRRPRHIARRLPAPAERHTVDEAADSLRRQLALQGARKSYLEGCESMQRPHRAPTRREASRQGRDRGHRVGRHRDADRRPRAETVPQRPHVPARGVRARDQPWMDGREPGPARGAPEAPPRHGREPRPPVPDRRGA